jgi:hypothetical protein
LILFGVSAFIASEALAAESGRFTRAFMRDTQPHRVYFRVACGGGDKTARVTLQRKTMEVSLRNGNPAVSEIEHMYFNRKAIAKRALRQARSGNGKVVCLKS